MARAFGVEAEIITPVEAGRRWPLMRIDDLVGAVWLPADGKVNPADLTQALARGARARGVRIMEGVRVTDVSVARGAAVGVVTSAGEIACDVVVNCGGLWAREIGARCGVTVPLQAVEHMYIVTGPIPGVTPDLAVMRDHDGHVYFKEEVGGLVMGGFEPVAKPLSHRSLPDDFAFGLLKEDWEQFGILLTNAIVRVPALEGAEIRRLLNGPESFTPDNQFLLGEAPEVRGFFIGAGFNSAGIASAGGAGRALAEWVVEGRPTVDLWPVDIRRFARVHGNTRWLAERARETPGLHYRMAWPNREYETGRDLRHSPLYARLAARGACFGAKMGWERALWFAPAGVEPRLEYGWGRQNWFPHAASEHRAARERVAVFDQSSFSKFLVTGPDAEGALQRLCAGDVAVAPGRVVYTPMLNRHGGYETDLTVTRLGADTFFVVTGTAQTTRDADWITRQLPRDARVALVDVTAAWTVLSVMGPQARALLSRVTEADLSDGAFPFATWRDIEIGPFTVRATRITYVGELGWELYVPVECATGVYDALIEAGGDLGLANAGYYALDSLRLEKGYRAWGRDLTPDDTPLEAGLGFAVRWDKSVPWLGREALELQRARGVGKRQAIFTLDDSAPLPLGDEPIHRDGVCVGAVTSAAYGHTLGRSVALGWVRAQAPVDDAFLRAGRYEIEIAGDRFSATLHLKSPYDPTNSRVRA